MTVVALARGTATVTVTAADPSGREAAQAFQVTVPNSGPDVAGTLPDLELARGGEATVEVSSHFTDGDGDALTYRAETSDAVVASADAAEGIVTVSALARGGAAITVTAADPDGLEASLAFEVTVPNSAPKAGEPIADIELELGDTATVVVAPRFTYYVTLKDAPEHAEYPLTMTVDAPATLTVAETNGAAMEFASATDTVSLTVTTAHDLNIVSEMRSLTHKAEDVTVTVTAGSMTDADRIVTVTFTATTGTDANDFTAINNLEITISAMMTSGDSTIQVNAAEDTAQDEANESITVGGSNSTEQGEYYASTMIMIQDDDPDVQLLGEYDRGG